MIHVRVEVAKNIKNAAVLNKINVHLIAHVLCDMQYVPYAAPAV